MGPVAVKGSEALEAEASAWLIRRDREDWSEDDAAALEDWLEASAHNRVAYLRMAKAWRTADRLRAIVRPAPANQPRHGRWGSWPVKARWTAMAAVAATLLAIGVVIPLQTQTTEYSTPIGGHRTITLSDQSRIELDTNSKVKVRYTEKRRIITLVTGEVYFEMKHNPSRPVEVLAGDRRVTMLGTKFMVRHDTDEVTVLVTEGRVRVDSRSGLGHHASAVLTSNETLAAKGASSIVLKAPPEKIAEQMSWRLGRLTFHQTTLADAAEKFNRYNEKPLVVADGVAHTRIGGSFDPRNAEGFAELLHTGFGFSVRSEPDRIFISQ
jgi:transmembrane sensor